MEKRTTDCAFSQEFSAYNTQPCIRRTANRAFLAEIDPTFFFLGESKETWVTS